MDLPPNRNLPLIMHIDLNSCFATVEQQANPLLRGKPVAVAAYTSPNGCILSPSIEAKKAGVKVGMTVREGRVLSPGLVILPPDPPKYRYVHLQFRKIFRDYSPNVSPKSIDEAVIDFSGTPAAARGLVDIGYEIKSRLRREIGEWISCNIGIGTNRFLAKTAASLHKPDGLDIINHQNLDTVLGSLALTDLCGINTRNQVRLNAFDIYTPLEFRQAPLEVLTKQVFKSITGYYWYLRLRGWEIDAIDFSRRSFGHSYAIPGGASEPEELSRLLMKLTEKMGRRLRRDGYAARGVHLACMYCDGTHWHLGRTFRTPLYGTQELYRKAQYLLHCQPEWKPVGKLAVSCFDLLKVQEEQLPLFDDALAKNRRASVAMDVINDRYGEFVITPAIMLGMEEKILDRISFGGVTELLD
jgi:DNA polymerase-4